MRRDWAGSVLKMSLRAADGRRRVAASTQIAPATARTAPGRGTEGVSFDAFRTLPRSTDGWNVRRSAVFVAALPSVHNTKEGHMAIQYRCDYCGEPIEDDQRVRLIANGSTIDGPLFSFAEESVVGLYHGDERRCWEEVIDRIGLVHAVSSDLGIGRQAAECRIEQRAERQQRAARLSEKERDHREREQAWRRLDSTARDELLLRTLGGEQLTIREWTARLNHELGSPSREAGWPTVHESSVAKMAKRLVRDGVVARTPESFMGKMRYRWSVAAASEAVA